jgi:dTDP-4-dehydrorhamnose reductase
LGFDKPVLITGGNGQLGRALAKLLPEAFVFDHTTLDVGDRAAVVEAVRSVKPATIINAVAYTKVDAAEADEQTATEVNSQGVEYLASAANEAGALLVHVSTDYVFRGDKEGPYKEEDQVEPLSVYGKTKLKGEVAASNASKHVIVRTSWVFGDGQNFIRSIVAAARDRDELSVVDDQRGVPTYAPDLARGIIRLLQADARGLYHLTNGGSPATWADLAEFSIEAAGLDCTVSRVTTDEYFQGKPGPIAPRPRNSVLDCSKAAALGVTLRPWKEAVAEYVALLVQ